MFGFTIVHRRKKDIAELEVLKNAVNKINERVRSLYIIMNAGRIMDAKGIQKGLDLIEDLKVDALIYAGNRFSTPLQTYSIVDTINEIGAAYRTLVDMTLNIIAVCSNDQFTDEDLKNNERFLKLYHGHENAKQLCIIRIKKLVHIMLYDNERINLGVNIIDDYYKHRHIKPPNHPNDLSFTVRFMSQQNKKINSKE